MAEKLKQEWPVVAKAGWLVEHRELILSAVAGLLLLGGLLGIRRGVAARRPSDRQAGQRIPANGQVGIGQLGGRSISALSRAFKRIIRQNLYVSLGVVALLIPATLFSWAGIGVAVLIHEGSTLVVVINALRLLAYKEESK